MLNWLCRYAPVRELLCDDDHRLRSSLLDVGCGPHGFSCVAPEARFVGLEVDYPVRPVATMSAVKATPGRLPFADASFGSVACLDVLEHIPRPDRAGVIAEMCRVAAERVVIACPEDSGAPFDAFLKDLMLRLGRGTPEWLAEHQEYVLPSLAEVEQFVTSVPGFRSTPLAMPHGLLAQLLALGDILVDPGLASREAVEHREEWIALCNSGRFGQSFRAAWVIERIEVREPIVDAGVSPDRLVAALRCNSCAEPLERESDRVLVCTGCGRVVPRTSDEVWDLAAPQFDGVPTDPARTWVAEPQWELAHLNEMLAGFGSVSPGGETLVVRADPDVVAVNDAVARLQAALGGAQLPAGTELLLVHEPLSQAQRAELAAAGKPLAG